MVDRVPSPTIDEVRADPQAELTPQQIVQELDKYIIGQEGAKRAVAIALRNRWRRQQVQDELREEIMPNNILMIGPTGVGKTEISRRLARLANAPFIKVEASKFTEVGYVGRDVESIIRDLIELAVNMVREEREEEVLDRAEERVEERLLDLLLPPIKKGASGAGRGTPVPGGGELVGAEGEGARADQEAHERRERTREKVKRLLEEGQLEDRMVEVEVATRGMPFIEIFTPGGMEEMDINFSEMLEEMLPTQKKRRRVTVAEARRILLQEEVQKLIDMDEVVSEAIERVEQSGIVFVDELDKVVGERGGVGPDVSREGVQRDLLPIIEGCSVPTKYGLVRTDHTLFIAAGAFHVSKPSDLIPELQGRLPIRVELDPLTAQEFERILIEPENALVKQYQALLESEGVDLRFTPDSVKEIARLAQEVNEQVENIGARRLQTVMNTLLDEIMFNLPESGETAITIDATYVTERLAKIVQDRDLRNYIL